MIANVQIIPYTVFMFKKDPIALSAFIRFRNRFLRFYDKRNSSGGTIFYKVVRNQVKKGILPKEFLDIIEEQKRESKRVWIREYRKEKAKKAKKQLSTVSRKHGAC